MTDEIIDVIDQTDRILGQKKRSIVHQTGEWHRGIHIFVFNPDERLIIHMRGDNQDKYPGTLDCSVSEHLLSNENYLDGAIRGLYEELGLDLFTEELRPLVRFKMQYGYMDNMFSTFYELKLKNALNIIESPEGKCIYYFEIEHLIEIATNEPSRFSYWFIQLLYYYIGKPHSLEIVEHFSLP